MYQLNGNLDIIILGPLLALCEIKTWAIYRGNGRFFFLNVGFIYSFRKFVNVQWILFSCRPTWLCKSPNTTVVIVASKRIIMVTVLSCKPQSNRLSLKHSNTDNHALYPTCFFKEEIVLVYGIDCDFSFFTYAHIFNNKLNSVVLHSNLSYQNKLGLQNIPLVSDTHRPRYVPRTSTSTTLQTYKGDIVCKTQWTLITFVKHE